MPEGNLLVALTLNPAIDRFIELDKLRYGELNRISASKSSIAGKGYHAALVNQILGGESFCIGISFKNSRAMIENFFLKNSLPNEFIEISGDLRVNLKILDCKTMEVTEINDKGAAIGKKDIENLIELYKKYLGVGRIFVFTGSLPPGVNPGIYRDFIAEAEKQGSITVLSTEGIPLMRGLESRPSFVKANTYEINKTFGITIKTPQDAASMCKKLIQNGVKTACITLGSGGAVIYSSNKAFYAPPPASLVPGSTVGAGDALIGAVCNEILRDSSPEEMLKSGVAAAAAKVVSEGVPFISLETYNEFRDEIVIHPVKF